MFVGTTGARRRREVADGLGFLAVSGNAGRARTAEQLVGMLYHFVIGDGGTFDGVNLLYTLASLIDPRCEVVGVEPARFGERDEVIGYDFRLTCGHVARTPSELEPPSYCPECGSRVVVRHG